MSWLNLRTGLETDDHSITFWAEERVRQKVQLRGLSPSPARSALAQVGAPRSFGVTFRA